MKRLFDEEDCYTTAALDFDLQISQAVEKIMQEWVENGYSVRELSLIAQSAVHMCECKLAIECRLKPHKKEQHNG